MIIRRCSQGHRVRIHKNTTPGVTRAKTYVDGSTETLTYPTSGYDYFVEVDGSVVRRSESFKNIEEYYVKECSKKHDSGHGRIDLYKHKFINAICYNKGDV